MSKYPKTLYVKQICKVDEKFNRTFSKVVKNEAKEIAFREQAGRMEPNFSHEFSETPFDKV